MNTIAKINIEAAIKLWNEGVLRKDMAEQLGIAENSLKNFTQNHRDKFPKRVRGGIDRGSWSAEREKTAIEMWLLGHSATAIGAAIGLSRLAVLGKAFRQRHNFPMRNEQTGKSQNRQSSPKQRVERVRNEVEAFVADPTMFSKPTDYDLERLPLAKSLMERADTECHWPINDGGPFLYCSAEMTGEGSRYCNHHHRRAHPVSTNTHTGIAGRRA